MEQSELPIKTVEPGKPAKIVRPVLALEKEDVGNLDMVLRGYYLSQIKSMEKRKDRKLARRLLENHLLLPKSRQRTSKDSAYIKEILGIDHGLLDRLEESRLIRRIQKRGNNPIYEVSHDTLVEPILAERKDREAIARFIKKTWKYLVLLLLLWFLFGMLFENHFEVLPDIAQNPKTVSIDMEQQVVDVGDGNTSFMMSSPATRVGQKLRASDSITVRLPIDVVRLSSLLAADATGSDTISITLESPIEVPVNEEDLPVTYQSFSDVLVPLAHAGSNSEDGADNQIFAKLSGNLKMVKGAAAESGPSAYDQSSEIIEMELGDTLVEAGNSAQSLPVDFNLRLTDFFDNEADKNRLRNTVGDRQVKLSYVVQVGPAPVPPPPPKASVPSVEGVEVQYSDGTSRFIPGDAVSEEGRSERIHIVVAKETLFSIAKRYGIVDENGNTSAEPIKKLNGLRGNAISVGQALRIPVR